MTILRFKMILFLVIIGLLCATFAFSVLGLICPAELIAGSEGSPLCVVRDNDFLCTGISQIVTDENYIYVLFGTYSVVQAYTHEGEYCYSVSVYNYPNGRTMIAAYQNELYICDKKSNIYIFEDGKFKQFVDRKDSAGIRSQLSFWDWAPDYSVHLGSVWYAPDGEPVHSVIQRPRWLSLYQKDPAIRMFPLMVLAVVVLNFPHKTKHNKTEEGSAS